MKRWVFLSIEPGNYDFTAKIMSFPSTARKEKPKPRKKHTWDQERDGSQGSLFPWQLFSF